ncbi:MAG: cobaltochelatase subunit CobN [Actinomycetota bacterium]|nr:cobaltochelatase subunit CobN [Actinomycetota bacterium]
MILFLTNADTELLALRVAAESMPEGFPAVRGANPDRLPSAPSVDGVRVVLVRLLGGRQAWREQFDDLRLRCVSGGVALLAFGGESVPDAELTGLSTVASATVTEAFAYLVHGGVANVTQLLRFVADTVLLEGFGFDPPAPVPTTTWYHPPVPSSAPEGAEAAPTVGIVFYRAHLLAGNTQFVDDLAAAVRRRGGRPVAVATYSLRPDEHGVVSAVALLAEAEVDVVLTTTLAAGSLDEEAGTWDAGALGSLGVPIVQAVCATAPSAQWAASAAGLGPTDVAMSVAVVEFDGRIVSVPFSFKEVVDDDDILGSPLSAYRTVADRTERVAGLAVRLGRLRHQPPAHKRVALVLSAYPTKRSRLGNAVGLDTPASVVELLHAMADAGYQVERIPADGDSLMAELADGLTYGAGELDVAQLGRALGTMDGAAYAAWFAGLPEELREQVAAAWGPAPGRVGVVGASGSSVSGTGDARLVFSGIDLGGVLVAVQPPRGFGENPVAVYHSPDLAPTHHYLAFYRWLDAVWGADAIVHLGKHGTLEWLPGKGVGPSASCAPDAALGDLPLVYPFVVNDPGEGTQAKRRTHAVIVDHLVPPLTRADTYDDLARLEQLLDEHARVVSLDPAKLPALRRQVWDCLVAAEIHRDMGLVAAEAPAFEDPAFDDLLVEVDGYLCELKDAQIRGGLHVLGQPPGGGAELDLVLAITRLAQGPLPSLRQVVARALGVDLEGGARREVDAVEAECRRLLAACQEAGWHMPGPLGDSDFANLQGVGSTVEQDRFEEPAQSGRQDQAHTAHQANARAVPSGPEAEDRDSAVPTIGPVAEVLRWVCERLAPALAGTAGEIDAVLGALDGRFVPPGPSGAPSRGHAHVLPTGRNFYAVDPRAIPSRLAWAVGVALAERLVERHVAEEGRVPRHVALVVWGTAAMRTAGDDVAEALALLGVRPVWEEESGRVTGLTVVPLAELGRPRVDVTLRVSGFFRDAFPHVVSLIDEAMSLVSALDEPPEANPLAGRGDEARIFGPKPGAYGSGILALLEGRNWRSDDDLAAVYVAWGGWSYRRGAMGAPDADALRLRLAGVEVAVKNQDNREHDIFDSDDYLQDHGGMVAAIRSITGRQPKAWFGDSADPARPTVRSLAEEAARVVRSRVVNPKWIGAMMRHGYKGAFEMAATVDYLFGYDATARVVEDWMYEKVTEAYVGDPEVRKFLEQSNPWALRSIAERLLEASDRGLWQASDAALGTLGGALLEAEGWEEDR